jgi:hypothetical protein
MRPRLGTALSAPEKCVETLALTLCRPASKNRAAQALNNFLAATIDRQPALPRQLPHSPERTPALSTNTALLLPPSGFVHGEIAEPRHYQNSPTAPTRATAIS